MNILGISSNYHDSSAAIVIKGEVIASSAEERFTLQKHDPSFPEKSINYCLKKAGIKKSDIDLVVYHEDPHVKLSRTLSSAFKNFPYSLATFIKTSTEACTSAFWLKYEIAKYLSIDLKKIMFIPHHLSHCAHSFLTSGFDEAAIVTIDAVGEWTASCIFHGTKTDTGFKLEPLEVFPFPNSLGLVYSAFTAFLGFKVNDGECSTMALSAFGKPRYLKEIKNIILLNTEDVQIDLSYFDFKRDDQLPFTEKFYSVFGAPRSYKSKYSFDCMDDLKSDYDEREMYYADVACSLQTVLEEAVLLLIRKAKNLTGSVNLCYGGGVALNCVANSKILESKLFENVYIPCDPGDGGGAMGAALFASMFYGNKPSNYLVSPYLGQNYEVDPFLELMAKIDPSEWNRFSKIKTNRLNKDQIEIRKFDSKDAFLDSVAQLLADNQIIGFFNGRFENGPRALGNRSILCRADNISLAKQMSETIKLRASFRPYACAMTEEFAKEAIEDNYSGNLNKWMQASFKIKKEYVPKLRAGLHIDHSTRAQIVSQGDNQDFYSLLKKYGKICGVEAIINTSFNEQGFPIVASPIEALIMFARTNLKYLAIENVIIAKRE
ncbi:MAG: carbamoyltransferase N-terminal domain-containing protein [Bacteriovorax sp.]|jgi:carbamoyltransferase